MKRLIIAVTSLMLLAACSSSGGKPPATSSAPAGGGTSVGTASGPAGTFLTDGSGRSLYLFEKDSGGTSTCSGDCAGYWPPLIVTGSPTAGGGVNSSLLGTIMRSDGKTQATYAGHPLYTYEDDKAAGDTNGQGSDGFGAKWWLVDPSGKAITAPGGGTSASTSTSTDNGGGYGGGGY